MSILPPETGSPDYLVSLNEPQRRAAETVDGPVLVLAGAGTGKTRVLTTRLVHILLTRRAFPSQILAVTFTNKAAREMRDRLDRMLGGASDGLWLGTFHALAARILRRHAEIVGLKSNFTILDSDDQLRLMKQIMAAEKIDDKRWPARAGLGLIDRWKDRGLAPGKVNATEAGDFAGGRLVQLYRLYQDRLQVLNACDFGDLLLHNLTIFLDRPDILAETQRKFRYLLVDEYQDTNVAQYLWLRLLAQSHRNICCVGDDDQSIYGWRGAEIGNILRFEQDFPGAQIIRLEQNYRSTPQILAAAGHLIAHNSGRLGKTLWTDGEAGDKLRVRAMWDGEEEARWVADEVEAQQRRGISLAQMAILVRTGSQTRAFEERFIACGIPYRVIGGPRFYERQEIRDALAYLRLVHQPDDDLAFERIVNLPRRGIGDATLQILHEAGRAGPMSLMAACRHVLETDALKPAARRAIATLVRDIDRWRERSTSLPHTDLAELVLDESGYTAMWQADKTPEAPGRLENLKELIVGMAEFDGLVGFLEHVSLVMENAADSSSDLVSVMTLHAAKGLEFDSVFLPGWEEGLFPHQRALDENGLAGLEEERRLAYVGLTRARRYAAVSHAANRRIHGQWQSAIPSRFVSELPEAEIDAEGGSGLFSGRQAGAMRSSFATPIRTSFVAEAEVTYRPRPSPSPGAGAAGRFKPGERVFHQKFGAGTIQSVEDQRLTIHFDQAGEKKIMASFIERAPAA